MPCQHRSLTLSICTVAQDQDADQRDAGGDAKVEDAASQEV